MERRWHCRSLVPTKSPWVTVKSLHWLRLQLSHRSHSYPATKPATGLPEWPKDDTSWWSVHTNLNLASTWADFLVFYTPSRVVGSYCLYALDSFAPGADHLINFSPFSNYLLEDRAAKLNCFFLIRVRVERPQVFMTRLKLWGFYSRGHRSSHSDKQLSTRPTQRWLTMRLLSHSSYRLEEWYCFGHLRASPYHWLPFLYKRKFPMHRKYTDTPRSVGMQYHTIYWLSK
jgi:hypothetical protein